MVMAHFTLSIVTPQTIFFEGQVSSLVVPAALGYLGVLAHHAPLVASMRPGNISFKDMSGKLHQLVSKDGGFLEFSRNTATLLLDSIA